MEIVLSDKLKEAFEPRYIKLKEQLAFREVELSDLQKNYKENDLEACSADLEIKNVKKLVEHAKSFVRIYSPVVDEFQQEIDKINTQINSAKAKKISAQYTAEMRDDIINNLTEAKKPLVSKRDDFKTRLQTYVKERDENQAKIDKLEPVYKIAQKNASVYKERMILAERQLKRIRLDIKKLKTEFLALEINSRSDYKRFDTADCFACLPSKILFKFWDKKPHIVNGNYSVYAGIDILEVTESQVTNLSVISINGKFYRGVSTEYDPMGADYQRIEFVDSEDDSPNLKVGVSEYAVNLYYLLYGLNSPSYMLEFTEAQTMLEDMLKHKPILVKNLPLYIFGNAELEKIVRESVKSACATIVTNYKKKNGGEMPDDLKNYIKELGRLLKEREKLSSGDWQKKKANS